MDINTKVTVDGAGGTVAGVGGAGNEVATVIVRFADGTRQMFKGSDAMRVRPVA